MGGVTLAIAAVAALVYLAFHVWYGGRGKPLGTAELEGFVRQLEPHLRTDQDRQMLDNIRALAANDDGREFVMQNLVRHRARAQYPPGHNYGDDPREADRRYGRAIIGPLLRFGNVVIFVARRRGTFVAPAGAEDWHYVAMVRYRSLRDFLRFACVIEREDIALHKWAAIETTHVFPVQPMVSLFAVRTTVALLLTLAGLAARACLA